MIGFTDEIVDCPVCGTPKVRGFILLGELLCFECYGWGCDLFFPDEE